MTTAIRLHTAPAPDQPDDTLSREILVPVSSIHFIHGRDTDVKHTLVYMLMNGEPLHVHESLDEIEAMINGRRG